MRTSPRTSSKALYSVAEQKQATFIATEEFICSTLFCDTCPASGQNLTVLNGFPFQHEDELRSVVLMSGKDSAGLEAHQLHGVPICLAEVFHRYALCQFRVLPT